MVWEYGIGNTAMTNYKMPALLFQKQGKFYIVRIIYTFNCKNSRIRRCISAGGKNCPFSSAQVIK